jgi:sugar phosphate isomerase/epimerase
MTADLKELADLLAAHKFRLAYENWCWATHAPNWKDVWQIVKKVDRPNIGLCLDTFQTAGGEWGDPTTKSGLIESESREELRKRFQSSLDELSQVIPRDKIYLLQISDAYKPQRPLDPNLDESGLRPKGRWSRSLRPMPFDGGYLPIVDVAKAVLRTGFRGWFSMEIFDGGPQGKGQEWNDMPGFAKNAMESHKRLLQAVVDS